MSVLVVENRNSNVAATALYINPNIKFKQIDTHIYQ